MVRTKRAQRSAPGRGPGRASLSRMITAALHTHDDTRRHTPLSPLSTQLLHSASALLSLMYAIPFHSIRCYMHANTALQGKNPHGCMNEGVEAHLKL